MHSKQFLAGVSTGQKLGDNLGCTYSLGKS